jgi:hypothetical protein
MEKNLKEESEERVVLVFLEKKDLIEEVNEILELSQFRDKKSATVVVFDLRGSDEP